MNVQISRLIKIGLAFIVLLITGSWSNSSGQAQPGTVGYSISGQVTDSSNHPIPGITITATFNFSLVYLPAVMNEGQTSAHHSRCPRPPDRILARPTRTTGSLKPNPAGFYSMLSGAVYSTTTDMAGNYNLSGLPTGVYTVTPSHSNYSFIPGSQSVTLMLDTTNVVFTGTLITYTVSGQVIDGSSKPISGVTISAGAIYTTTIPLAAIP